MGNLIEATHIDLRVHPDYIRANSPGRKIDVETRTLLALQQERAEKISTNPKHLMFYFTIYRGLSRQGKSIVNPDAKNVEAARADAQRVAAYSELLDSRFFVFPGWSKPAGPELTRVLEDGGYTYNRQRTELVAYGEWLEHCVDTWFQHIRNAMGLEEANCRKDTQLSLLYKPKTS